MAPGRRPDHLIGRLWRWGGALVLAALLLPRPAGAAARHDVHVSHARVVVEGPRVLVRVRVFRDDLELALARRAGQPGLRWSASPAMDSLFGAYFAAQVQVDANGRRLAPRVLARGAEKDPQAGEPMVWYLVALDAPAPVTRLALANRLLFDVYADQQNLVLVLQPVSDRRQSLYFVRGDEGMQVVEL